MNISVNGTSRVVFVHALPATWPEDGCHEDQYWGGDHIETHLGCFQETEGSKGQNFELHSQDYESWQALNAIIAPLKIRCDKTYTASECKAILQALPADFLPVGNPRHGFFQEMKEVFEFGSDDGIVVIGS